MGNEIRPEKPATEKAAFEVWVNLLTDTQDLELENRALAFLVHAHTHLALWLITKSGKEMDSCIAAIVSAIVYDEKVAPILGAYIDWGRAAVREHS